MSWEARATAASAQQAVLKELSALPPSQHRSRRAGISGPQASNAIKAGLRPRLSVQRIFALQSSLSSSSVSAGLSRSSLALRANGHDFAGRVRGLPNQSQPSRRVRVLWTSEGTFKYRLAEREGFEPPIRLPVCRISSAVHSTTLPPLQTIEFATQSPIWLIAKRAGCYPFATQSFWCASLLRLRDHGQRARQRLPAFPASRANIDPS